MLSPRVHSVVPLAAALLCLAVAGCGPDDAPEPHTPDEPAGPATFVGRAACVDCHQDQHAAWTDSHHDLAMQEATPETVLGDFDDASVTLHGITSTFRRTGDTYVVRTEGADGNLHDFEVAYVFGVTPLQQYLVAFPGGRYQTLPLCWDTRPADAGGQRWFHLYGEGRIAPKDELFWTGPAQNWNSMCADCHSTRLRRGYDVETDRYETTWSEIDVSCEACHGPGSAHLAWAEAHADDAPESFLDTDDPKGLVVTLRGPQAGAWEIDPETGNAKRERAPGDHAELDACARCHSRRVPLRNDHAHGRPFLDSHRPALLDESLYFADGQVREEVYVYGSFLQSRMYAAGVTCSDCHDAHSLELHRPGNALCSKCHLATKYDNKKHHFHAPGTDGAACVDCHMPERTYMGVDPRRDHSLRIPRPDLTITTGSPNACNGCHADQTPQWSEEHLDTWYGKDRQRGPHLGHALHAGRRRSPGATDLLAAVAADPEQSSIGRASALALLRNIASPTALETLAGNITDPDPLVRQAAVGALAGFPAHLRTAALQLLDDDVLAVRVEAARVLAAAPQDEWQAAQRERFEEVFAEFVAAEMSTAGSAAAHVNLGVAFTDRQMYDEAEAEYRIAAQLSPHFLPAYINLADLYRLQGRDEDGQRVLRDAITEHPGSAALHHALGLVQIRLRHPDAAVRSLGTAAQLAPESSRYAYVHALAVASTGDRNRAIDLLEQAQERDPTDLDVVLALATTNRDAGKLDDALRWAELLVRMAPDAPGPKQLLEELLARRDRR